MALDHTNATATVFVDGLAVCCYNPHGKKWDLAFLHDDQEECVHRLDLRVDGVRVVNDEVLQSAHLIEIIAENPQTPDYTGSPSGFFDLGPLSHHDRQQDPAPDEVDKLENFRWTINLEDQRDVPHGHVTLKKPDFPLTRAFIHNGVFYTAERSPEDLILTLNTENPNGMGSSDIQGHTLGKTNDVIAADIFCDPDGGGVVLMVDGKVVKEMPHRPGNPWQISLTNLCDPLGSTGATFEKGDFHHFYDVLKGFTHRHAIWGQPRVDESRRMQETRGDDASLPKNSDNRSGRTDCDTVFMGPDTQTLDPLFGP